MNSKNCYMLIKAFLYEGDIVNLAERALFFSFEEARQELFNWVERDKEEDVVCYFIREIPAGTPFEDRCTLSIECCLDAEEDDEPVFIEHVFLPSGEEWTPNFLPGDLVEHLYQSSEMVFLTKGVVYRTPTVTNPKRYVILDNERSIEGLSKEAIIDCAVQVPVKYAIPLKHFC